MNEGLWRKQGLDAAHELEGWAEDLPSRQTSRGHSLRLPVSGAALHCIPPLFTARGCPLGWGPSTATAPHRASGFSPIP